MTKPTAESIETLERRIKSLRDEKHRRRESGVEAGSWIDVAIDNYRVRLGALRGER